MKTLIKNFKCLAFPKGFVSLTFQKSGGMVGYVMLILLLTVTLIYVLPTFLGNSVSESIETMDAELPDFYYEDGHFSFGSGREFLWENDQNLIYICTAAESFSTYSGDHNYYANVLDGVSSLYDLPQKAVFVSSTDLIYVEYGSARQMDLDEVMTDLGISSFDKEQFLDALSTLIYVILSIGDVFILIGGIAGIFFFALIWGLIAFVINRSQRIKYSYGRMYRLAVYVMVPMRILKMLCTRFLPLPSNMISWVFTGLILLYLILALLRDQNQKMILQGSQN